MHNIKLMNAKTENECKHKSHTQISLNAYLIFQLLNHYHQFHEYDRKKPLCLNSLTINAFLL